MPGHGGRRLGAGRPKGGTDKFATRKRRRTGEPVEPSFVPLGIDADTLDPRQVLAQIALDIRASSMSRVAAAKALLEHDRRSGKEAPVLGAKSAIIERALAGLSAGKSVN